MNYKPIVKLLKKILPHGMPEVPRIHKQIEKAINENGYINCITLLRIINMNHSISDNVKKAMTGDKNNYFFEINFGHLIEMLKIEEGMTWFRISIINDKPMIRANFGHTLPKVKPELIADKEIDLSYLKEGLQIFVSCPDTNVDKFTMEDTFAPHKSYKFWTNKHPPHFEMKEGENWIKVFFDAELALNLGMRLFLVDDRVFCTKGEMICDEEELNEKKAFFKIPCNLFYLN